MHIAKTAGPLIYIAGPFFNPDQQQLVTDLEVVLDAQGYHYYSPFSAQGRVSVKVETAEQATTIFESNMAQLEEADVMIAILDYLLPKGQTLRAVNHVGGNEDNAPAWMSYPLCIPDTGTIFEVGVFAGIGKPVIGFTSREPRHCNLMVTQSMQGVCYGFDALAKVFDRDGITVDAETCKWKGGFV